MQTSEQYRPWVTTKSNAYTSPSPTHMHSPAGTKAKTSLTTIGGEDSEKDLADTSDTLAARPSEARTAKAVRS